VICKAGFGADWRRGSTPQGWVSIAGRSGILARFPVSESGGPGKRIAGFRKSGFKPGFSDWRKRKAPLSVVGLTGHSSGTRIRCHISVGTTERRAP